MQCDGWVGGDGLGSGFPECPPQDVFTFFTVFSSLHTALLWFCDPSSHPLPGKGSSLCTVSVSLLFIPSPPSVSILLFFLSSLFKLQFELFFSFIFHPTSESNTCVLLLPPGYPFTSPTFATLFKLPSHRSPEPRTFSFPSDSSSLGY